jgi:ribosomal protein S18 acetylase RimI-like enzyme
MMDLVIRAATALDADALRQLAGRLAEFELPAWRAAERISSADAAAMLESVRAGQESDQVFIAQRAGTVVGCLHVLEITDFFALRHGHVSVLATSREAEGSGVARALMGFAEEWTRRRALPLLTLNVFAHNGRARRFYEVAGFVPELVKYAKAIEPR